MFTRCSLFFPALHAFKKHSEIRDFDEKVLNIKYANMQLNFNDAPQASVYLCTFLCCYLQANAI